MALKVGKIFAKAGYNPVRDAATKAEALEDFARYYRDRMKDPSDLCTIDLRLVEQAAAFYRCIKEGEGKAMTNATDVMAQDIEALRRERDELYESLRKSSEDRRDYYRAWKDEMERADALAAHVERINTQAGMFFKAWDTGLLQGELETLRSVIKDAPTTSLARLKAEWQAEALQGAAEAFDAMGGPAAYLASSCLKDSAAKIRHQAEEAPCSSTSPSASPSASC